MANSFQIEINDRPVIEALNRLRDKGNDMSPAMRAIATELASLADHAFQQEGPGWAPHAEATILARMGRGGMKTKKGNTRVGAIRAMNGMRLLQDSGALAGSITPSWGADFAQIGSNKVYAAMQQFGGTKAKFGNLWGDIPARPFLPVDASGNLTPTAQASILEILSTFLEP